MPPGVRACGPRSRSLHQKVAAQAPSPTIAAKQVREGVRDARYCEIIPVVRDGFHFVATVYNTLALNDCPATVWNAITEEEMIEALRRHQKCC